MNINNKKIKIYIYVNYLVKRHSMIQSIGTILTIIINCPVIYRTLIGIKFNRGRSQLDRRVVVNRTAV